MPLPALLLGAAKILGPAAASFLPSLFGRKLQQNDPMMAVRKGALNELDPATIEALVQSIYRSNMASPATAYAKRGLITGSQAMQNAVASRLGAGGLGGSGVGALAYGAAAGSYGTGLAGLNASMWTDASQRAQTLARDRSNVWLNTPVKNYTNELLGAGLGAFGPLLYQYMQNLGQAKPNATPGKAS